MFERTLDWHLRDEGTLAAAREYFDYLRRVFTDRPDLVRRLAHCADCGMPFLADPRNRGRTDLRCVFGCREAHYKEQSARSSAAYYRTPDGQKAKKAHNNKRSCHPQKHRITARPVTESDLLKAIEDLLPYLCLAASLIERRRVERDELLPILRETVRQRSIDCIETVGYFENRTLHKPP